MNHIIVSARGLTKSWRNRRVLDNVNLDLKRGTVTAVLGPSGTGKSTLLRVIAGLENVDVGTVSSAADLLTDGHVIVPPEHRKVGLVFQDFSLFPHLTALENVMFGLHEGNVKNRKEKALEGLASVQMADKARAYPHTLSGGEQQRVALARAMAPRPDVVLLDEAFSGLDSKLRVELRDTALHALQESGAAVLVVTHDAEEAMFMADELALMIDGRFIQSGSPDQVYLHPNSLDAARLLGEVNSWTGSVSDGKLSSPFGTIDAPQKRDGDKATILARPEAIRATLNSDSRFEVIESHLLGAHLSLKIKSDSGEVWQAVMPINKHLAPGSKVNLDLDDHLMIVI